MDILQSAFVVFRTTEFALLAQEFDSRALCTIEIWRMMLIRFFRDILLLEIQQNGFCQCFQLNLLYKVQQIGEGRIFRWILEYVLQQKSSMFSELKLEVCVGVDFRADSHLLRQKIRRLLGEVSGEEKEKERQPSLLNEWMKVMSCGRSRSRYGANKDSI